MGIFDKIVKFVDDCTGALENTFGAVTFSNEKKKPADDKDKDRDR